jgi:type II secretory pathway pseudopilin PulG
MRQTSGVRSQSRPSFTLIELIVVLAILLALAALVVAMAPRMAESQKISRAADQLQGWISLSRQWARSAHAPTGVRLLPSLSNLSLPNGNNYVTNLEYIQKPPDFVVAPGLMPGSPVNVRAIQVADSNPPNGVYNTVKLEPMVSPVTPLPGDFSGGYTQKNLWPVQLGDYFQANGGGLMHRIGAVVDANTLLLDTSLPQPINSTKQYRIIRKVPRALPGEATLQLAQDVVIDLAKSYQIPTANADGSIDILFAPSGSVIVAGANDKIILWVRDVTRDVSQDPNTPGDQTLIAIYVRTGLVAAFEVAPGTDPYLFTRDGRSSGL